MTDHISDFDSTVFQPEIAGRNPHMPSTHLIVSPKVAERMPTGLSRRGFLKLAAASPFVFAAACTSAPDMDMTTLSPKGEKVTGTFIESNTVWQGRVKDILEGTKKVEADDINTLLTRTFKWQGYTHEQAVARAANTFQITKDGDGNCSVGAYACVYPIEGGGPAIEIHEVSAFGVADKTKNQVGMFSLLHEAGHAQPISRVSQGAAVISHDDYGPLGNIDKDAWTGFYSESAFGDKKSLAYTLSNNTVKKTVRPHEFFAQVHASVLMDAYVNWAQPHGYYSMSENIKDGKFTSQYSQFQYGVQAAMRGYYTDNVGDVFTFKDKDSKIPSYHKNSDPVGYMKYVGSQVLAHSKVAGQTLTDPQLAGLGLTAFTYGIYGELNSNLPIFNQAITDQLIVSEATNVKTNIIAKYEK